MNRKDRIAVVASIGYFLGALLLTFQATHHEIVSILFVQIVFTAPLTLYWSYRFIKNDISFLKVKDD